tara:strand:- start:743 stop:1255 length:513 start_codon:yes stop_codon:yes gene_type:complete
MSKGVRFSSLWQSLVDDGYDVGTYDEFVKKMGDSSKSSSLESFLKSEYNLDNQDIDRITKMERMLEEEEASKTKFPSLFQMGRNLVKDTYTSMKAKAKGYNWMTSVEIANQRLEICRECPFFAYDQKNPETGVADGRCLKCGCFMNTKAHWASAECPIGKWGKCTEIEKS